MRLLWECLSRREVLAALAEASQNGHANGYGRGSLDSSTRDDGVALRPAYPPLGRLVGNGRCRARRKDGQRCRGKAKPGSEFCFCHDPAITPDQRRANAIRGGRSRKRRVKLPRGYPKTLDSLVAVQVAMDRLYTEIRRGKLDADRGRVLFDLLRKMADMHRATAAPDAAEQKRTAKLTKVLALPTIVEPVATSDAPHASLAQ